MKTHYLKIANNVSPNMTHKDAYAILRNGRIYAVKCVYDESVSYGWYMRELNDLDKQFFPYTEEVLDIDVPYGLLKYEMTDKPYDGIGCNKEKVLAYKETHKESSNAGYPIHIGLASVENANIGEAYVFLHDGYMCVGVCVQDYGKGMYVMRDINREIYCAVPAKNIIKSGSEVKSARLKAL